MEFFNLLPTPADFLGSGLVDYVRQTLKPPPRDHRSRVDFDIDPIQGFIPRTPPRCLDGSFSDWEQALKDAPHILMLGEDSSEDALDKRDEGELWRLQIRNWPILDVTSLGELRQKQRAHLVLSWLLQFYVHSTPNLEPGHPVRIPASISVPLVAVSKTLGIAPVLTFADTVLWNWEPINPDAPFSQDNMRIQNLFSGTEDEEHFYKSSLRTEAIGAEMLRIFDEFQDLRDVTTMAARAKIVRDLKRLSSIIDDVKESILSMRGEVDPHVFYFLVRPWWVGNTKKTWVFEGVSSNTDKLLLDGPSAGQSTSMHALDVFLGIDHKKAGHGFMNRMRQYMPGKHRDYLGHIASIPVSLRSLAQQAAGVSESYDKCVLALKALRDSHIRIATLYVVSMSRQSAKAASGCPVAAMMDKMDRVEAQKRLGELNPVRSVALGTGGNELSKLLKAGRDATGRAILSR